MNIKSILLAFFTLFTINLKAQNNNLLNEILNGKYWPYAIPEMTSMADGEHYTQLSFDSKKIVKCSFKTGKEIEVLFDVDNARGCDFEQIDGYILSPTDNRILIYTESEAVFRSLFKAYYWVFDIKRNLLEPLSEKSGKQQCAAFSPNGRMIAFARDDNNLYLKKLDYGTEIAMTKDGNPNEISNGVPDWLYNEEFSMQKAFDWSSDSQQIAFIRFDEAEVQEYSILKYPENENMPTLYKYKYPRAGTKNPKVSVHVYSVETKDIKRMDLPNNPEYIPRLLFTPDPSKLAIMTMERSQNTMTMYYANPKSTVCKQIFRDESDTFLESSNFNMYCFNSDHFVAVSERDGYRHAYLYTLNGVLVKQLTSGNYDVTNVYGIDSKNTVYYQIAEENPLKRDIYSVNDKGKKSKLSRESGCNEAVVFSKNYTYFVNKYSSLNSLPFVSMNDASGKQLYVIEANETQRSNLKSASLPKKEFIEIKTEYGVLNGWMLKPGNFKNNQKYPVLLMPYGGPGSQSVIDTYNFDWEYYLASQGYIVVCVDGIGTGGRGSEFRKASYLNLGIKESDSQIAVAKYLKTLSYIDGSRIGIYGWSFGGYNALMSMSRGDGIFKVGIAVAPVTDWKLYGTVYTERYMRTPNENYDGYIQTSAINLTPDFQGKILLIHGMADDNVHVQHTLNYIEKLTEEGKDFDSEIVPNKDHNLSGGKMTIRLYNRIARYIIANL